MLQPIQTGDISGPPVSRIVLIGASNLTLSLPLVIGLAQSLCGPPSLIFTAYGHGRSYGRSSQAMFRVLPGITRCQLWPALNATPPLPTYALLTDIGNDIAYGYPPEQLIQWISRCIERLQQQQARIVVTDLPLAALTRISDPHFLLLRAMFFPFSLLSRRQMLDRVRSVSEQLHKLAAEQNFILCTQNIAWYGIDSIHIRKSQRLPAYRYILSHFAERSQVAEHEQQQEPGVIWQRRNRPRFYEKSLLGRRITCAQPSCVLADGSAVFCY
jgi:hypothetical protein